MTSSKNTENSLKQIYPHLKQIISQERHYVASECSVQFRLHLLKKPLGLVVRLQKE